jgi:hypothetical protein
VARLLAERTARTRRQAKVMRAQVGDCPKRNDAQMQNRCDPYCLDLVRLFRAPGRESAQER